MTRQEIINAWRAFLGVKRLHQGRNPLIGLDCAGLLYCANLKLRYAPGVDATEPYNTAAQTKVLDRLLAEHWTEKPIGAAQPGDLMLFHLPREWHSHIALLSQAPDWLIHTYEGVGAIVEHPLDSWLRYLVKVYEYRGITE